MFPSPTGSDRDVVAGRLSSRHRSDVGQVAAQFGVDGVSPKFGLREVLPAPNRSLARIVAAATSVSWQRHRDEDDQWRAELRRQGEADRIVGRRVAGVQRGDDIDGRPAARSTTANPRVFLDSHEAHAPQPAAGRPVRAICRQFGACLDADDLAAGTSAK